MSRSCKHVTATFLLLSVLAFPQSVLALSYSLNCEETFYEVDGDQLKKKSSYSTKVGLSELDNRREKQLKEFSADCKKRQVSTVIEGFPYVVINNQLYWYTHKARTDTSCGLLGCGGRHSRSKVSHYKHNIYHKFIAMPAIIDFSSLKPLSQKPTYYVTDGKHLIYRDKIVNDVEMPTELANTPIKILFFDDSYDQKNTNNTVIVYGNNVIYNQKKIPQADAQSYELIDENERYTTSNITPIFSKDKNHVYWRGQILENADPVTFVFKLKSQFIQDKNQVWSYKKYEELSKQPPTLRPDIQPNTYAFDNCGLYPELPCQYTKNENQVIYKEALIEGADPHSFKTIPNFCLSPDSALHPLLFCKDEKNAYLFPFTMDKDRVYYNGSALIDVDVNSFGHVIEYREVESKQEISVDKSYLYYTREVHNQHSSNKIKIQGFIAGPLLLDIYPSEYAKQFVFADEEGFFAIDYNGHRRALLADTLCASELGLDPLNRGKLKVIQSKPEGVDWAFEDDYFQYFFISTQNSYELGSIYYMVDKKTNERYRMSLGLLECPDKYWKWNNVQYYNALFDKETNLESSSFTERSHCITECQKWDSKNYHYLFKDGKIKDPDLAFEEYIKEREIK